MNNIIYPTFKDWHRSLFMLAYSLCFPEIANLLDNQLNKIERSAEIY